MVQWHMEHLGLKYFENIRETHQYLTGFMHAEESLNDEQKKEGYWINDFTTFALKRFYEGKDSTEVNKQIEFSESYVNYIYRIQESNTEGFKIYYKLLLEFSNAN